MASKIYSLFMAARSEALAKQFSKKPQNGIETMSNAVAPGDTLPSANTSLNAFQANVLARQKDTTFLDTRARP